MVGVDVFVDDFVFGVFVDVDYFGVGIGLLVVMG